MSNQNEKGIALVTALLYLFIITLLVTCIFSASMLQTKISTHMNQAIQTFEYVESALLVGEQAINPEQATGHGEIDSHITYQFHQISRPECGLFYEINATGNNGSNVKLRSVFVFPQAGEKPCPDVSDVPHRVVWEQGNYS